MCDDGHLGSHCKSAGYADIHCDYADLRWVNCTCFAKFLDQYNVDHGYLVAIDRQ